MSSIGDVSDIKRVGKTYSSNLLTLGEGSATADTGCDKLAHLVQQGDGVAFGRRRPHRLGGRARRGGRDDEVVFLSVRVLLTTTQTLTISPNPQRSERANKRTHRFEVAELTMDLNPLVMACRCAAGVYGKVREHDEKVVVRKRIGRNDDGQVRTYFGGRPGDRAWSSS